VAVNWHETPQLSVLQLKRRSVESQQFEDDYDHNDNTDDVENVVAHDADSNQIASVRVSCTKGIFSAGCDILLEDFSSNRQETAASISRASNLPARFDQ
jgi:hypothetical protein